MNFWQRWILKRKLKRILKLFEDFNRICNEIDKSLNEYLNLLFKFGVITAEDIRKKAEKEVQKFLEDKKFEEWRKLSYIS